MGCATKGTPATGTWEAESVIQIQSSLAFTLVETGHWHEAFTKPCVAQLNILLTGTQSPTEHCLVTTSLGRAQKCCREPHSCRLILPGCNESRVSKDQATAISPSAPWCLNPLYRAQNFSFSKQKYCLKWKYPRKKQYNDLKLLLKRNLLTAHFSALQVLCQKMSKDGPEESIWGWSELICIKGLVQCLVPRVD